MGIEILHAAYNKKFFEHEDTKAQSRYREANIAVGNYYEVTIAKSIYPPKTL